MYSLLIAFALCNLLYFTLHVTSGGSFPKPLSAKEERECLEKMREGDMEAKNRLIEHNLRLVAHIIKRYYYKRMLGFACIPQGCCRPSQAVFQASHGACRRYF